MSLRLIVIAFAVLTAFVTSAAGAVEVRLKDEAHCAGSLVCLGDIAELVPQPADGASSLAHLALFPAPSAVKPKQLRRQELIELLALCEVDVRALEFTGAESVVIRSGPATERTIIRPALHLIPASSYVQKSPAYLDPRAAAAAKPTDEAQLVRRNTAVTIHSIWPGVKVTASGKSMADGALGESVLVEQANSKQRVLAKVVGPQTVELRPETN